jgi:UDP-3-O-[3-hydroxymyristoyl] glucosamine N-acyltransferase
MDAKSISLADLARKIGGELVGDGSRTISAVRPFDEAGGTDLTFLDHKNAKMVAALPTSKAGAVIVNKSLALPAGLNAIRIDPPHLGLARSLAVLHRRPRPELGVSPASRLGSGVTLGERVNVYPGAYLGDGVRVGDDTDILPGAYLGDGTSIGSCCVIHPHVTIYGNCQIGNRVTIHAGAVIGADGFGYVPEPRDDGPSEPFRHAKIPQIGGVVIEDDVEIGANTTIDRATLAATIIGRGTKIDNLVMIGHNCTVGRHTIIVAQAGISGSTDLGDYVTIAGQAGLVGHITVGDRAVITAKAGVTKDVEADKVMIGAPAMDIHEGRLAFKLLQRLPDFKKKIEDLLRRVKLIEDSAGGAGEEKKPE